MIGFAYNSCGCITNPSKLENLFSDHDAVEQLHELRAVKVH